MTKLAGIGKSARQKLSLVLERNPVVIKSGFVSEVLNITLPDASQLLAGWSNNGWLYRLKRGSYVSVPLDSTSGDAVLEDPFLIAELLYQPGYIGGFSAVKHWDLSEQIIETIYYFTTRQVKDRSPKHGMTKFKIKTLTTSKMFGTKTIWYGSKKVKVSDPSKTIVDILDDPKLVGGMTVVFDIFSEYINSDYCDFDKLYKYSLKIGNKTVIKRLGFMMDVKLDFIPVALENIQEDISSGYSNFDSVVKCDLIVEKWKLKVSSSWKREYDRKK